MALLGGFSHHDISYWRGNEDKLDSLSQPNLCLCVIRLLNEIVSTVNQ